MVAATNAAMSCPSNHGALRLCVAYPLRYFGSTTVLDKSITVSEQGIIFKSQRTGSKVCHFKLLGLPGADLFGRIQLKQQST